MRHGPRAKPTAAPVWRGDRCDILSQPGPNDVEWAFPMHSHAPREIARAEPEEGPAGYVPEPYPIPG